LYLEAWTDINANIAKILKSKTDDLVIVGPAINKLTAHLHYNVIEGHVIKGNMAEMNACANNIRIQLENIESKRKAAAESKNKKAEVSPNPDAKKSEVAQKPKDATKFPPVHKAAKKTDLEFWYEVGFGGTNATGKWKEDNDWAQKTVDVWKADDNKKMPALFKGMKEELLVSLVAYAKSMEDDFGGLTVSANNATAFLTKAIETMKQNNWLAMDWTASNGFSKDQAVVLLTLVPLVSRNRVDDLVKKTTDKSVADVAKYIYDKDTKKSQFAIDSFGKARNIYITQSMLNVERAEIIANMQKDAAPETNNKAAVSEMPGTLEEYSSLEVFKKDWRVKAATEALGGDTKVNYETYKTTEGKYSVAMIEAAVKTMLEAEKKPAVVNNDTKIAANNLLYIAGDIYGLPNDKNAPHHKREDKESIIGNPLYVLVKIGAVTESDNRKTLRDADLRGHIIAVGTGSSKMFYSLSTEYANQTPVDAKNIMKHIIAADDMKYGAIPAIIKAEIKKNLIALNVVTENNGVLNVNWNNAAEKKVLEDYLTNKTTALPDKALLPVLEAIAYKSAYPEVADVNTTIGALIANASGVKDAIVEKGLDNEQTNAMLDVIKRTPELKDGNAFNETRVIDFITHYTPVDTSAGKTEEKSKDITIVPDNGTQTSNLVTEVPLDASLKNNWIYQFKTAPVFVEVYNDIMANAATNPAMSVMTELTERLTNPKFIAPNMPEEADAVVELVSVAKKLNPEYVNGISNELKKKMIDIGVPLD